MPAQPQDEHNELDETHILYNPFHRAITLDPTSSTTTPIPRHSAKLFLLQPWYAPLLIPNASSDARDHCANERTYLSYLRLSIYLSIVSVAIYVNFHLTNIPTPLERRFSHPLGLVFGLSSLACLAAGFANYVRTVARYARREALVQSGVKTQVVFGVTATGIVAACAVLLWSGGQARAEGLRVKALCEGQGGVWVRTSSKGGLGGRCVASLEDSVDWLFAALSRSAGVVGP